jgi:hypothetical protein
MATAPTSKTITIDDNMTSTSNTTTDNFDTQLENKERSTPTSSNRSNKQKNTTQINTTTENSKTTHLLSSQPRFSTTEILQRFPHIQHRYCHKIKISVPWDDKDNIPTTDTYHKAIHYFFELVQKYDQKFQLLPWDVANKKCNNISSLDQLPRTHNDLSSYLYNVHMTPSRVRASMVVTSSYNLGDLIRSQYKGDRVHLELLKTFRKEKLWVQPTSIQTMGEIKLIGFLQYVHPKFTNLKKLALELQAIVETRDLVVELYRPRAVDDKGHIITAPEAIAIGAPSDISIKVYKSLIDKWASVLDGHYDVVIGKGSTLKMGYFIPFVHGILNRQDKNEAIISHEQFTKEFTSIKIRQCSSVDMRFKISQTEMATLDLQAKKKKPGELTKTTLRKIINSWYTDDDSAMLIQAIEQSNVNTQLLVIKKIHKGTILNKLHHLMDTLKTRNDFAQICGNSDGNGANIDKFVLTRNGHNYLSYLKGNHRTNENQNDEQSASQLSITDEPIYEGKRKLQQINSKTETRHITEPKISPVNKKPTTNPFTQHQQQPTIVNSRADTSDPSTLTQSVVTGYADIVKKVPFTSVTKIMNANRSKNVGNETMTKNKPSPKIPTTTITQIDAPTHGTQLINIKPQPIVPYVEMEATELTISTMTPEVQKMYPDDGIVPVNSMSQLTTQQVQDITTAVSHRYDNMLHAMHHKYDAMHHKYNVMEKKYNAQIHTLINTQKSHTTEIETMKKSQGDVKNELELQIHDKIEKQMTVLTSLVDIVQNMQNKDQAFYKKLQERKKSNMTDQIESEKLSDHDLSYSDRDDFSNSSEHNNTIGTKTTLPNTIDTDNSVVQSHQHVQSESEDEERVDIRNTKFGISKVPPEEIQYVATSDSKEKCKHTNNIPTPIEDDIRNTTLTNCIDPTLLQTDKGWENVTNKTKNAIRLKHATISPVKPISTQYNRSSPNFNKYDPEGSITRRSSRLQNKRISDNPTKDHLSCRTSSSVTRGRKP